MFCAKKQAHYCAKCAFKIKSNDLISCTRRGCDRNFHLLCVGESEISEERRENWRCERCSYGFRIYGANLPSTSKEPPRPTASGSGQAGGSDQPLPLAALAEIQQQPAPARPPRAKSPPRQRFGQRQTNLLCKQVEIYGLNKREKESELQLKVKVVKIANIIQLYIKLEFVEAAIRVANPYIELIPDYDTVVLVRFVTRTIRNIFLDRLRRLDLSNGMIDNKDPNPARIVHVFESLKYRDRVVFTTARNRSLSLGYKYCWTLDGITFVKKDDETPFIRISSLRKLDKYLPLGPDTK